MSPPPSLTLVFDDRLASGLLLEARLQLWPFETLKYKGCFLVWLHSSPQHAVNNGFLVLLTDTNTLDSCLEAWHRFASIYICELEKMKGKRKFVAQMVKNNCAITGV